MAYFKISQPNQPTKWIKSIDRANGTLEFSENRNECFQQDSGFFADSEFAYLKFHFTEAYPELEFMSIDCDYGHYTNAAVMGHGMVEAEAPNVPIAEVDAMEADDVHWNELVANEAEQFVEVPVPQADANDGDTPW